MGRARPDGRRALLRGAWHTILLVKAAKPGASSAKAESSTFRTTRRVAFRERAAIPTPRKRAWQGEAGPATPARSGGPGCRDDEAGPPGSGTPLQSSCRRSWRPNRLRPVEAGTCGHGQSGATRADVGRERLPRCSSLTPHALLATYLSGTRETCVDIREAEHSRAFGRIRAVTAGVRERVPSAGLTGPASARGVQAHPRIFSYLT